MGQTSGDKWEIYDHVETILGRMQRRIAILSMNRWNRYVQILESLILISEV